MTRQPAWVKLLVASQVFCVVVLLAGVVTYILGVLS